MPTDLLTSISPTPISDIANQEQQPAVWTALVIAAFVAIAIGFIVNGKGSKE